MASPRIRKRFRLKHHPLEGFCLRVRLAPENNRICHTMKTFLFAFLACACAVTAQDFAADFEKIQAAAAKAADEIKTAEMAQIEPAKIAYGKLLDDAEIQATQAGKLDVVKAIVVEKDALGTGGLPIQPAPLLPRSLMGSRGSYQAAYGRAEETANIKRKTLRQDQLRNLVALESRARNAKDEVVLQKIAFAKAALLNGDDSDKKPKGHVDVLKEDWKQNVERGADGVLTVKGSTGISVPSKGKKARLQVSLKVIGAVFKGSSAQINVSCLDSSGNYIKDSFHSIHLQGETKGYEEKGFDFSIPATAVKVRIEFTPQFPKEGVVMLKRADLEME
jgi:hypothetical protein